MAKNYKKTFDNAIPLNSKNSQRIIQFFLFECPVKGTSFRGATFEALGWKGTVQFSQLKRKLLAAGSTSLSQNYYPCAKNELTAKFDQVTTISPVDEYCVFLKNAEDTVMQSLFSAIRNAFAHGSFSVRTYTSDGEKFKIYFFSNYKDYLKAEIVLQEGTLLNWIDIVQKGYLP